jgi:hypothetical protein
MIVDHLPEGENMVTFKLQDSSGLTTLDPSSFRREHAAGRTVGRAWRLLTVALATVLSAGCAVDTSSGEQGTDDAHEEEFGEEALGATAGDPCTNPSDRPVAQKAFLSNDPRLGDAVFRFYDFDKSSRRHTVPIERTSRSHIYIVEVGSQSRDPGNTRIIARTTSADVRRLASGGSTDKYQTLHELRDRSVRSVTFNQPTSRGKCIRDEGQYVVIYTNNVMSQVRATMRDPELTGGHDNQYGGAPNDSSVSLIADDETNHPNRVRDGGATQRMLASAAFNAFANTDNGFFIYKRGARVPTFTGNGCDAQYQF